MGHQQSTTSRTNTPRGVEVGEGGVSIWTASCLHRSVIGTGQRDVLQLETATWGFCPWHVPAAPQKKSEHTFLIPKNDFLLRLSSLASGCCCSFTSRSQTVSHHAGFFFFYLWDAGRVGQVYLCGQVYVEESRCDVMYIHVISNADVKNIFSWGSLICITCPRLLSKSNPYLHVLRQVQRSVCTVRVGCSSLVHLHAAAPRELFPRSCIVLHTTTVCDGDQCMAVIQQIFNPSVVQKAKRQSRA